jgi:hypothetical protein
MVEQARGNNKEISFPKDFARSATERYALFSGRSCPFACTGAQKNNLSHRVNLPPSQMNVVATPDRIVIPAS